MADYPPSDLLTPPDDMVSPGSNTLAGPPPDLQPQTLANQGSGVGSDIWSFVQQAAPYITAGTPGTPRYNAGLSGAWSQLGSDVAATVPKTLATSPLAALKQEAGEGASLAKVPYDVFGLGMSLTGIPQAFGAANEAAGAGVAKVLPSLPGTPYADVGKSFNEMLGTAEQLGIPAKIGPIQTVLDKLSGGPPPEPPPAPGQTVEGTYRDVTPQSGPQRTLANIASGKPTGAPPPDLQSPAGPVGTPAAGEAVGLRYKAGPPRRATVDHYFDNGNAVRLRMDDGSIYDLTTADLLKNRTEPPAPVETQPAPASTGPQLGIDEAPFPPDDLIEAPPARRVPPPQAPLGGDMLNALDHADALEKTALNQALKLSGGSRQDMLAEAARLRRLYGHQPDADMPPNAYVHPMAGEPAADLGALAAARVAHPDLYQGPRAVPPPNVSRETMAVDPYALEDVQRARGPMPKGKSLFDAMRDLGGIKDDGGDVRQIMQGYRNPPFIRRVFNPDSGLHPDDVRSALQEQGWFGNYESRFGPDALPTGSYPGDDLQDLYDLMDREARGEKIYHPDSDTAFELEHRRQLDEDLGRAGVGDSDSNEVAARKLAEYRQSELAARDAWERSRASHQEISPEAEQGLAAHGYEPGADIGAEFENAGGGEEGAEGPPPDLISEGGNYEPGESVAGPEPDHPEDYTGEREDIGRRVEQGKDLFATEPGAVDAQGRPVPQTIIPGAEKSDAQRAAAMTDRARAEMEARQKQGKLRRGNQQEPGGLFGEEKPQKGLFEQPANRFEEGRPPFYSGLTRAVEGVKMEKAPPGQWEATIKNLPGVKSEEIDWSGVNDWLRTQTKSVTKAEVLAHLRDNEVRVQEVMRGGNVPERDMRAIHDWVEQKHPDLDYTDTINDAMRGDADAIGRLEELGPPEKLMNPVYKAINSGATKFSSYTLPGGSNYRELLLTLPKREGGLTLKPGLEIAQGPDGWNIWDAKAEGGKGDWVYRKGEESREAVEAMASRDSMLLQKDESGNFRSSHFDEPNVLAHVRFDDRTGPNGEKVLHVAEIQSDWSQTGRRKGWRGENEKRFADLVSERDALPDGPERDQIQGEINTLGRDLGVPDTPFKKTEAWAGLAARRMLRYAAEHGYDRLSWDTGETQAARYDLSKQISEIHYSGTSLKAYDHDGKTVIERTGVQKADLPDIIGKDAADKLLAKEPVGTLRSLRGLDLKVGGDGMRGFYDKILPNFLSRYAKKWGAKVEDSRIGAKSREYYRAEQRSDGSFHVINHDTDAPIEGRTYETQTAARAAATRLNNANDKVGAPVHSIPITPAMRESVMGGQAMFQPGAPTFSSRAGEAKDLAPEFSDWLKRGAYPDTGAGLSDAVREYLLNRGAVTEHEALGLHDLAANAITHMETSGNPNAVQFSDAMAQRLMDPNANIITHHNHPSSRSLSAADLGTLAYPGHSWVVAHGHDGNFFAARLSPKWRAAVRTANESAAVNRNSGMIRNAVTMVENALYPHFRDAVKAGHMTAEEANDALNHATMQAMAQHGTIDYVSSKELAPHVQAVAAKAIQQSTKVPLGRSPQPVRYEEGIGRVLGERQGSAAGRSGAERSGVQGQAGAGKSGVTQLQLLQDQPRYPSNPAEAADRRDSAADAMAEELRTSGSGTYARLLNRMGPPSGDRIYKDPNAVQNVTIRPETISRLDTRSAAKWNAEKAKDAHATTMVDDLRERIAGTMLKLPEASRNKVFAARELDRINGQTRADTGHQIVARNDGATIARLSKPGDVVTLNPQETAAYHALTDMFDRAWKNIMEGAARKVGWEGAWDKDDMAANIATLTHAAENSVDRGTAKTAQRAAAIVNTLDAQRRQAYHPLMRFGDYFAHVTPKIGTDMSSTGGFPKTVWFELAERGLADSTLGGSRVGNQSPPYAKEMLGRLAKQYPADKFDIEHGYLAKNPDMLDRVDIPAIEKLMTFMENDMLHSLRAEGRGRGMSKADAAAYATQKYDDLYGRMVDQLWEKAFQELQAGYRKQSRTVGGYSDDFGRALGTYMHWTSRNVADQIHRPAIDEADVALQTDPRVNPNVKRYWQNWNDYQKLPSNIFNKGVNGMARWGFLTAMGVNPSSSAVVGMHGLFMAGPTLSTGIGMAKAAPAFSKAFGHAMSAVKVGKDGIAIPDVAAAGRTPAEKAFLRSLDAEGVLHSRAVEDMAALNEKQSSLWGSARSTARKMMDLALSNVSVMDRANRIASALSAYRLAGDPKTLAGMDAAWRQNQIWRDRVDREGVNQESMARFMVPNMVGEYGRMNQAPIERNAISRMMLGMHSFVTRLLGNMWKLGSMGPDGQRALMWTLGAFWLMAGLDGTPFAEDVQNGANELWKVATRKDPMIGYRIQAGLATVFGKVGAQMILHGPSSALGVDLGSRLGLGDLISRNLPTAENVLGAYPSIIWGRVAAAASDVSHGHPGRAPTEFLPAGVRNVLRAGREAQEGVTSGSGRVEVPASEIGPTETIGRGLGFTPEKAEEAYERGDYLYRARRAKMSPPPNPIPRRKGGRAA